jgi:hypothetical protein
MITEYIASLNYDWCYHIANTYESAVEKTKIFIFDVIIADIFLDGENRGDEFCRHYKEKHPETLCYLITGMCINRPPGNYYVDIYNKPLDIGNLISNIIERLYMDDDYKNKIDRIVFQMETYAEKIDTISSQSTKIFECLNGDLKNKGLIAIVKSHEGFFKWATAILSALIVWALKLEIFK